MSYKTSWYVEGEIILVQFNGQPSSRELSTSLGELDVYMEQGQRPLIHTIIDLTQIQKSMSLVEMAQALRGRKPDARVGWVITVGEQDKLVKFTTSVMRQLLKMRQRSYLTLPEALDFLRDIDSGINWSKADNRLVEYVPQHVNVS